MTYYCNMISIMYNIHFLLINIKLRRNSDEIFNRKGKRDE